MGNSDISRNIFNPKKHYTSVRNQQGRVLTDDDWNENERIDYEIERRTNVDVIGPNGSPDNGFRIKKGSVRTTDNVIDFDILPGTYYLGGLRLELEPADPGQNSAPQTFRTQNDWLQQDINRFSVPNIGEGEEQYNLVYLEAWQQAVTAVEDSELYEAALGGPDTTTRIRNMARVHLLQPDTGFSDCTKLWDFLKEFKAGGNQGIINEDHELIPDTKLQITYTEGESDDLCSPSIIGGYLGAENQAIRVQLTGNDKLTWGFDNASSLYRIKSVGSFDTFKLITAPKDQHHWPLAGQIVEILPWSTVLINGEKTAELAGHISKVKASYNPDTSEITIEDPISSNFGNKWKKRSDHDEIASSSEFYYLRVWNRGSDLTSSPEINFIEGTPLVLGNTGIQITITGTSRQPADYWIIAARPETPNQVTPWELKKGISPHGVKRYFAPLAVLKWTYDDGLVIGKVIHDCRKTFRPLIELETCCTFTVGNGKDNKGDFNSIQKAIDNLPENGGKICILSGEYESNVIISKRKNIWITGCSEQTTIRPGKINYPVFSIHNSYGIKLTNLTISSEYGKAILVQDSKENEFPSSNIQIYENNIIARVYAIKIRVNNDIAGNNDILIRHNKIGMIDDKYGQVAISSLADSVIIEENKIVVIPPPDPDDPSDPRPTDDLAAKLFDPCAEHKFTHPNISVLLYWISLLLTQIREFSKVKSFKTLGGIQIEGGSEYVKILGNEIIGGKGNGITLGSSNDYKNNFTVLDKPGIVEISNSHDRILIRTAHDNLPKEGIEVALKSTNKTASGTSSTNGILTAPLQQGVYSVYLTTPGYNITGIEKDFNPMSDGGQYTLTIEETEDSVPEVELPPVYDVLIEKNTISNMGLSGIGSASLQNAENLKMELLALYDIRNQPISPLLMGMVENLNIKDNKITYCAQQLPDVIPENTGFGGIVLSSCENITIEGNHIADNGISHLEPICGIYIFQGDKIEIEHNRILNNGKRIQQSPNQNIKKGIRGGVYINLTIKQIISEAFEDNELVIPDGIPAVKIHNNIINQPFSQSLYIMAFGPVSIIGNQLTTQNTDIQVNPSSLHVSSVMVFNLGMSKDIIAKFIAAIFSNLAKTKFTNTNNIYQNLKKYLYLPNGNILFTNNQITLDLRTEEINFALSSQLIVSLDDVAYNNNQSEITSYIDAILADVAIFAATIRTNNNRFQEGFTFSMYSLLSYGFMNAAVANLASHCLLVLGQSEYIVDEGNRVLLKNICKIDKMAFKHKYISTIAKRDIIQSIK